VAGVRYTGASRAVLAVDGRLRRQARFQVATAMGAP
jgi:hypothetical protein